MSYIFYKLDVRVHRNATRLLSYKEEGVYIRLCHVFFESGGKPLSKDIGELCNAIDIKRTHWHKKVIKKVLDLTFEEQEDGYINKDYLNTIKAIKSAERVKK